MIFVGLDMGPIIAAHEEDRRHTIWMALIFLLISCSGIVSLLLAQGYRTVRSSLSRIKAFSDSLVENMPIGLVAVDHAGKIIAFNQTAEAILDRRTGDVLGRRAEEILTDGFREIFHRLTDERRIIEREIDFTGTEGRTILLEVIATALHEEDGVFLGYVILFRDMTEMRRLKQEVARSQRLASLGSLAAGVAHEIRNPLSSIKGFATYFRERYRGEPRRPRDRGDDDQRGGPAQPGHHPTARVRPAVDDEARPDLDPDGDPPRPQDSRGAGEGERGHHRNGSPGGNRRRSPSTPTG